jgi:hypothetical protein
MCPLLLGDATVIAADMSTCSAHTNYSCLPGNTPGAVLSQPAAQVPDMSWYATANCSLE